MSDPMMTWQGDEDGDGAADVTAQLLALAMDPLGIIRRRWIWMLIGLLVGLAATAAFISQLIPTYESKATVVITSQQIPEDFVRSTVREDSFSNINAMLGEVLSARNLTGLIQKYSLYPEIRNKSAMSGLVNRIRANTTIEPMRGQASQRNDGSSVFEVRFTYIEPTATAKVADDMAAMFINASLRRRNEQARLTTEFLRREQDRAEAELAEANQRITEFQQANRGELPSDMPTLLNRLQRLNDRRASLVQQIADADERIGDLQAAQSAPSSPETALISMRLQLAHELSIHTDEHPNVISLRRRIMLLEDEVSEISKLSTMRGEDVQRDIDTAMRDREQLRDRLAAAEAEAQEIDARLDRIPERSNEISALQERAAVLRGSYLEFMQKVQDAELAEELESAQQGPRVTMLDRAQVPTGPARPMIMFLLPALVATIALAAGIGVGLELLDPVVLSGGHLEKIGSPALLGSMHHMA